jgi:2-(1,2-epoxy-1,2-dihydrophenyl)acetyl-CoA isomerase
MGRARAANLLLLNKKVPAADALSMGLLTEIVAPERVEEVAYGYAKEFCELDLTCLIESKRLILQANMPNLERANRSECDNLIFRWKDPAAIEQVAKFMSRKTGPKL